MPQQTPYKAETTNIVPTAVHSTLRCLAKGRCWIDSWLNKCTISHPAPVAFLDKTLCLLQSQLPQLWTEDNSMDVLPRCAGKNKPMTEKQFENVKWPAIYKCYIIKIISLCIMFYLALYLGVLCGFQNLTDAKPSTLAPKFSWVINDCVYYSSRLLFPGILTHESVIIWGIHNN